MTMERLISILEGLGKCNYDYKVSQEHIEQALEYYRNINDT